MLNFEKLLISKVVTLVVIVTFSITTTAYGIDLSDRAHLRPPIKFNRLQSLYNIAATVRDNNGQLSNYILEKFKKEIEILDIRIEKRTNEEIWIYLKDFGFKVKNENISILKQEEIRQILPASLEKIANNVTEQKIIGPERQLVSKEEEDLSKTLEEIVDLEERYYDGEFLKGASRKEVLDYFRENNITLKARANLLNNISLRILKTMASVINILPPEHLPKEIELRRKSLIFKDIAGGVPFFTKIFFLSQFKKIIIYTQNDVSLRYASNVIHETGHLVERLVKANDFYALSWGKLSYFRPSLIKGIALTLASLSFIFYWVANNVFGLDYHAILYISGLMYFISGLSYLIETYLSNKVTKHPGDFVTVRAMENPFEDFAETYETYVMHGDNFRKKMQRSEVLRKKYKYMKEHVFNGVEYGRDSDGKIIISNEAKPVDARKSKKSFFRKMFSYKASLGPRQKKAIGKIIDIYNNAYDLEINDKEKNKIINKKIILINRPRSPSMIPIYASLAFSTFMIFYNMHHAIYIYEYIDSLYDVVPKFLMYIFGTLFSAGITLLLAIYWDIYTNPDNTYDFLLSKIHLPLENFKNDRYDLRFLLVSSHALSQFLKLPNSRLLGNAYGLAASYKIEPQWFNNIREYSPVIILADEALEAISDPVAREATIRKILSNNRLYKRFKRCSDDRQKIRALLKEIASRLKNKDYKIPQIMSDTIISKWAQSYGLAIGYVALKSYSDPEDALTYINRLGKAKDSREIRTAL